MFCPSADLSLVIASCVLLFVLMGLLALKIALVRPDMTARDIGRLAGIAVWYALLTVVTLFVGLARVLLTEGGWARYAGSMFVWAELGAFLALVALSIVPAIAVSRWRRDIRKFATSTPCPEDVRMVRRYLWLEAAGLALVVAFAAAVARGYGVAPR